MRRRLPQLPPCRDDRAPMPRAFTRIVCRPSPPSRTCCARRWAGCIRSKPTSRPSASRPVSRCPAAHPAHVAALPAACAPAACRSDASSCLPPYPPCVLLCPTQWKTSSRAATAASAPSSAVPGSWAPRTMPGGRAPTSALPPGRAQSRVRRTGTAHRLRQCRTRPASTPRLHASNQPTHPRRLRPGLEVSAGGAGRVGCAGESGEAGRGAPPALHAGRSGGRRAGWSGGCEGGRALIGPPGHRVPLCRGTSATASRAAAARGGWTAARWPVGARRPPPPPSLPDAHRRAQTLTAAPVPSSAARCVPCALTHRRCAAGCASALGPR